MKVFVDVGSNVGQTVGLLIEPRHGFDTVFLKYGFDRICCFEPVPELQEIIASEYNDPRIVINKVGLWKETCERPIFSPGSQSGSIFADKVNVNPQNQITARFVRASDWFRDNLTDADEVYLKLNCEGCEVDIIEDLLDSNEYRKITSLGVSFDVKKIPSQAHRETEIKRRLQEAGIRNYVDFDLDQRHSHPIKIHNWLSAGWTNRRSLGYEIRRTASHCQIFAARVVRYSRRHLSLKRRTQPDSGYGTS